MRQLLAVAQVAAAVLVVLVRLTGATARCQARRPSDQVSTKPGKLHSDGSRTGITWTAELPSARAVQVMQRRTDAALGRRTESSSGRIVERKVDAGRTGPVLRRHEHAHAVPPDR